MKTRFLLPFLLVSFCVSTIQAEVPLLTPAELEQEAKHIVTGKVQRVYTTEKSLDKSYVDTLYAVEVMVSAVAGCSGIIWASHASTILWRLRLRWSPDSW